MYKGDYLKEKGSLSEKERRCLMIMDIIRRYGPISRPDISERLGLNVVTVSNYIDDFLRKSLLIETQFDVSEGGRKPILLDLNLDAGYAVGVGINLFNIVGVLVDIKGNIIYKVTTDIAHVLSSTEIVSYILDTIRRILQRYKNYINKIKGIGIGIAGLVNKENGSIRWPQRVKDGYDYISVDIPLKDITEREFGLSVFIDNDATCSCFGEAWFEKNLMWKNILYMFSGVGCGVMLNGEIYRGSSGYAGEMSIYSYKEKNSFNCQMGNPCFLKRWEQDLGIVEAVKKRLSDDNDSHQILELVGNKVENINLKTIFIAQRLNNSLIEEVLEMAAVRLGIKIAFLVNFLNPEAVIIGGGIEEAGDIFLKKVTQTVKEWAFREATEELKIFYSTLGDNAAAYGAAALAIENFFIQI
ncbi:MAG: ROK family transcriptional regulator [Candidatus Omnitrophica bacterium]|nr:ROK family transcriptional regulator [Candidatus Omnitrophota bacterium]